MSQTTFPVKKILVLLILLVVPGSVYYLLKAKGENRYRPLSIYGPKQPASTFHTKRGKQIRDTLYHEIREFKLLNQNGDSVSFPVDSAQITLVNFFFSRCPTFCSDMNREMARVAKINNGNRLLRFLSISVDPEYDRPDVLKAYSQNYRTENPKWDFLTGDRKLIYSLAKQDFLVDAIQDTTRELNFIHSPMIVLIDSKKRIRGYYDSTGGNEKMNLLVDEIRVLMTEELRNDKGR
ncbi:SCO family protein [Daejeonella lutea]|uniref:Protein SCO1/2 n=1 Tax=Daejeonella lutea TaxID=572036 RepID=A0A1T5D0F2_9SPHI|nr:SCO family protein [Daejeonella lutea]SKB65184.1 protein SCO1/2 [Daejeonella lutea]